MLLGELGMRHLCRQIATHRRSKEVRIAPSRRARDPATMIPGDRRNSERIAKGILRGVLVNLFPAWPLAELALTVSASFTVGDRAMAAGGSSLRSSS